jgi:hypothetical protein
MNAPIRFLIEDFSQHLPAPGCYPATITAARFRHSSRGNRMLCLRLRLDGVHPVFSVLADYFVLEGASSLGLSVARRRLLELYRACGLYPEEGDEVLPSHLVEMRVEVTVDHVQWQNQTRLRVLAYRATWPAALDEKTTPESHAEEAPHG